MAQLPDPSQLPLVQYRDLTGTTQNLVGRDPEPRVINEYVFSADKWAHILPSSHRSVDGILSQNSSDAWRCGNCQQISRICRGQACVNQWRSGEAIDGLKAVEIRDTGTAIGLGVYATCLIPSEVDIGEFLGELMPLDTDRKILEGDTYVFEISGVGFCTSKLYGNWTRFVNHRCINHNLFAVRRMYGRRIVMMFATKSDIESGQQLCINYGRYYFESQGIVCQCEDIEGDHLPPLPGDLPDKGTAQDSGEKKRDAPQLDDDQLESGQESLAAALGPGDQNDGLQPAPGKTASTNLVARARRVPPNADDEASNITVPTDGRGKKEDPVTLDIDVRCSGRKIAHRKVHVPLGQTAEDEEPLTVDIDVYLKPRGRDRGRHTAKGSDLPTTPDRNPMRLMGTPRKDPRRKTPMLKRLQEGKQPAKTTRLSSSTGRNIPTTMPDETSTASKTWASEPTALPSASPEGAQPKNSPFRPDFGPATTPDDIVAAHCSHGGPAPTSTLGPRSDRKSTLRSARRSL